VLKARSDPAFGEEARGAREVDERPPVGGSAWTKRIVVALMQWQSHHHVIGKHDPGIDMERSIGSRALHCLPQRFDMPHQQVSPAL
jgi:hypothetical protein